MATRTKCGCPWPAEAELSGMNRNEYGGQSMVALLRRVMVQSPQASGWLNGEQANRWQQLGFRHPPDAPAAQAQHEQLQGALAAVGAEVLLLEQQGGPSLDAVYVHDASLVTDHGAICLRMGKPNRAAEPQQHRKFYESLGIPILGEIEAPGTVEGGDLVWLDDSTLLVGRGYRTNDAGIEQLRVLLASLGIEVFVAPLPHGPGPRSCLHLMSLLSVLDERHALVDLPWLSVETVELLRERDFRLLEIEPSERESLASNVLALGKGKLLAFEENPRTNLRLGQSGFEVIAVPGTQMGANGGGGPTCLTRPLLRG